jgi:hypothetical protein
MSDALFVTLYGLAYLTIVACAIDVLTWHPLEWRRTGHSQTLRLAIIMGPFFSVGCIVIGIPLVLIHLVSVRPKLVSTARQVANAGYPRVPRRPNLGLGWLWRELRVGQQIKGTIALIASALATTALFWGSPDIEDVPPWFMILFMFAMWPTFFVVCYVMLVWAQHFLPAIFADTGRRSTQVRLDQLAQAEYNRRITEFHRRQPPAPWEPRPPR